MRSTFAWLIGAVSVVAVGFGPPASAENLKSVVRTLNAIINPEDAWRLEDQARRHDRPDERHYWHNYGEGLEQQRRDHPQYRNGPRYGNQIDSDEAHRLEDQAWHNGRSDERHYWSQYREGLQGQHPPR